MGSCREQEQAKCLWVHGAGNSDLAVAACLTNLGVLFVILTRSDCIASLWQSRNDDRLKLHLPKQFCELPLMAFPDDLPKYLSKHRFVSYVKFYPRKLPINPRFNQTDQKAAFNPTLGLWTVQTQDFQYTSPWLIVATGKKAEHFVTKIAGLEMFQRNIVHTSVYKSGSDYENQKVLVIGFENSGMEISLDLCRDNATSYMVPRNPVHVPPREMFGFLTFGVPTALLKRLAPRVVDSFLLLVTNYILRNTDQ